MKKFLLEIKDYVIIILVVLLVRTFLITPAIVDGDSIPQRRRGYKPSRRRTVRSLSAFLLDNRTFILYNDFTVYRTFVFW